MKIGVVGELFPDSFADNIMDSLPRMGHDAIHLGGLQVGRPQGLSRFVAESAQKLESVRERFHHRIYREAREREVEAVVVTNGDLVPAVVEALRADKLPVMLWFPDSVVTMGRLLMFAAPYTAVFFKEPHVVQISQHLLQREVHYLPEACNSVWHRPPNGVVPDVPALVVAGNMYHFRARLLERLIDDGVPVQIYGPRYPRWLSSLPLESAHTGGYVGREDKARVFRAAGAVLNNLFPGEIKGVNCRLFEATGCGAALITEHRETLPELFEPGEEVITFSDYQELLDGARALLDDPSLALKLGDRAAARAARDHTYEKRLEKILAFV